MDQLKLLRTLFKFRKLIAIFVVFEWLYKAHKSRPVNWLRHKRFDSADHDD